MCATLRWGLYPTPSHPGACTLPAVPGYVPRRAFRCSMRAYKRMVSALVGSGGLMHNRLGPVLIYPVKLGSLVGGQENYADHAAVRRQIVERG